MHRYARHGLAVLVAGGLVVGASSCTSASGSSGTSGRSTATTQPLATGSPNSASDVVVDPANIDKAIAALPKMVQTELDRTGVPGAAVAVVHDGKVAYSQGFGVREVGKPDKVDVNTRFQLASVSKSIGATVVAAEVGKGVVAWDDPVTKYLPGFELSDPWVTAHVTIADLYSHRSGLPLYAGDKLEDLGYDRAAVLEQLRLLPLEPFRSTYGYTNFGLTAAAEAVAAAAGQPWEQLSASALYEPLGMSSTTSDYQEFLAQPDRAVLHQRIDGRWIPSARNPTAQDPAGGVTSTVMDLAKWMQLQLDVGQVDGKQLVDKDAILALRAPAVPLGPPDSPVSRSSFYGHGMQISVDPAGRLRLSHSGAFNLGAATNYTLLPSEDLGIVVLTNGTPLGVPETLSAMFMDIVETGAVTRDWATPFGKLFESILENPSELAGTTPPPDATHPPDSAYVGVYTNPYFGQASVIDVDGRLRLRLGPTPMEFALTPFGGDLYSFTPPGENSLGPTALTFHREADGAASSFVSEFYDTDGFGTWTRVPGAMPSTAPVPPADNTR